MQGRKVYMCQKGQGTDGILNDTHKDGRCMHRRFP